MPSRRQHVTDDTRGHARQLRRDLTPAEKMLWRRLRDQQMFGVKFRRQHPIEPYIVDFCCPALRLVIEIDGDSHAESVERDAARTAALEAMGFRVIRFTNKDVHESIESVLETILKEVQPTTPSPCPLPLKGERDEAVEGEEK
jgi:very-short-patch-repair endonuclease